MSPNGFALRFYLIALLEAQSRTRIGARPDNPVPLRREDSTIDQAWTDYVATAAVASGAGKTRRSVMDKKARQLQTTLKRLHAEDLVDLPNSLRTKGSYEGFLLQRDDIIPGRGTDLYRIPTAEDSFPVPLTLFTEGWIYVLEDSELALLLITIRNLSKHGAQPLPLSGENRSLRYGLGEDAFEAHRVLEYLSLVDVSSDHRRQSNGRIANYEDQGQGEPHTLQFLPEGLSQPAVTTFLSAIGSQLDQADTQASESK